MKFVMLLLSSVLLAGCAGTITPKPVRDKVASYDGNQMNSGFIGWHTNGCGIITEHAADRYTSLVLRYGKTFTPPVNPGDGMTLYTLDPVTYLIDKEHLVKFATMNRWMKSGRQP